MNSHALTAYLAVFACLLTGSAQALTPVPPNALESGHSAVWYDAENPGTGWVLEMLDNDRAAVYWYGFDEQGQPAWYVGAGARVRMEEGMFFGYALDFDGLFAGSGARFGDAFDPDDVVLERVGDARISFSGCKSGGVEFDGAENVEPLDRLTQTMGAGCAPFNGTPGFPVKPYAGQSGTWYDPERSGEGITVQWMARDEAVLYWFTYDTEGNPFWLVGVGVEEDGKIDFPVLYSAERSPQQEVVLTEWGSLALELNCNTGRVEYVSVIAGFGEGERDLTRLNALASPSCPYVAPNFKDLYTVEVTELTVPSGREIRAKSIAKDGTVVGVEAAGNSWAPVVLAPDSNTWTRLEGSTVDPDQAVLITPDATRVVANDPLNSLGGASQPTEWTPDGGWAFIPDFEVNPYVLTMGSIDRSVLTGSTIASESNPNTPAWVWTAPEGFQVLPQVDEAIDQAIAIAASDSGTKVIGAENVVTTSTPVPDLGHLPGSIALRWVDGAAQQLRDDQGRALVTATACSADCDTVYGMDTNGVELNSARVNQPWFWTADGQFGVFEALAYDTVTRHWVIAASADGTLALGSSYIPSPFPTVGLEGEAFLWTQATGVVRINELFDELGITTSPPATNGFNAIALSANTRYILLEQNGAGGKAVVMRLATKPQP